MITNNLLQDLWDNEECPIIDGIIFSNGIVFQLDIKDDLTERREYLIKNELILSDFMTSNNNFIKSIYQTGKVIESKFETIVSGEGSWGSDGFIASFMRGTNMINWIFTSDKINPIIDLEFKEGKILASNNCGNQFELMVNSDRIEFLIKQI